MIFWHIPPTSTHDKIVVIFHYKPSSYSGTPMSGKPHIQLYPIILPLYYHIFPFWGTPMAMDTPISLQYTLSGKRWHNNGTSPFFMGNSTISVAMFNRFCIFTRGYRNVSIVIIIRNYRSIEFYRYRWGYPYFRKPPRVYKMEIAIFNFQ